MQYGPGEDATGVIPTNRILDILSCEVNAKITIHWTKDRLIPARIIALSGKFLALSSSNSISYTNIVYFSLFSFKSQHKTQCYQKNITIYSWNICGKLKYIKLLKLEVFKTYKVDSCTHGSAISSVMGIQVLQKML